MFGFLHRKDKVSEGAAEDIAEITVINEETGIMYCGGMEELYQEVVQQYAAQGAASVETIQNCFEKQDWENYRIAVHGVKGTSLTIGAVALSERAKALEMAVKENQIEYVLAENEKFLKGYKAVLNILENKF